MSSPSSPTPLYPKFRLLALLVAVPVAVAIFWPLDGLDVPGLVVGFGFAFVVELTGLAVARHDQRIATELAKQDERERVREAIARVAAQESAEGPDAAKD